MRTQRTIYATISTFVFVTTCLFNALSPARATGPVAGADAPAVRLTVNHTTGNAEFLKKQLRAGDRIAFEWQDVVRGGAWPTEAVAIQKATYAEILTAWPSWKLAQQNEAAFAHTDVFAYDIEFDSPQDEIADVARTMKDIRQFLSAMAAKHKHPVKFSCGVNHTFGRRYLKDLAQADNVHIHCNGLLRAYPQKDPRTGQDYVQWAVDMAQAARRANPNVGLWFGGYVPGMDADKAVQVMRRLAEALAKQMIAFDGFTCWVVLRSGQSAATANAVIEQLRPPPPARGLTPQSKGEE